MMDCRDAQLAILEAGDAALADAVAKHVAECAECEDLHRVGGIVSELSLKDVPSAALDARVRAACHEVLAGGEDVLHFPIAAQPRNGGLWRRLAIAASLVLLGTLAGLVSVRVRSAAMRTQLAVLEKAEASKASDWFDDDLDVDLLSLETELLFADAAGGSLLANDSEKTSSSNATEWTDSELDSLDRELLEIEMNLLLESELL